MAQLPSHGYIEDIRCVMLEQIPSNPLLLEAIPASTWMQRRCGLEPFGSVVPATMSARPKHWDNPSAFPWDTFQQTTQASLQSEVN